MHIYGYKGDGVNFSHTVDEHPVNEDFKLHVHNNFEILCVVSGNVGYSVEGRTYELMEGSLIIMRNAETHKLLLYGDERYERYVVSFSPEFFLRHGFDPSLLDAFLLRPLGEDNLYLPSEFSGIEPIGILRQMSEAIKMNKSDSVAAAYLSALLYSVNTVYYNRKKMNATKVDTFETKMIEYVNSHLFDDISLTSISEELHMSASQINRIFNRLTGTSVYNYVTSKRLVYAQEMIRKGDSAQSTAQKCGFGDYSAFYRLYKKRFGHSPSEEKSE